MNGLFKRGIHPHCSPPSHTISRFDLALQFRQFTLTTSAEGCCHWKSVFSFLNAPLPLDAFVPADHFCAFWAFINFWGHKVHVFGVFVDHECHWNSSFLQRGWSFIQTYLMAVLGGDSRGRGTRPCLLAWTGGCCGEKEHEESWHLSRLWLQSGLEQLELPIRNQINA